MEKAPELAEWGFIPAAEHDSEVHRNSFPWNLFSIALLAGAATGAAAGAAWPSIPPLAETPVLEAIPRSDEPSEIWSEAADQQALGRARAALAVPAELPSAELPSRMDGDAATAPSIKRPAGSESSDSD